MILRTFITFAKANKAPRRVTPMFPERYTIIIYIETATASILRIYHLTKNKSYVKKNNPITYLPIGSYPNGCTRKRRHCLSE